MRSKNSDRDESELQEDKVSNLLEALGGWGKLNVDKWWKKIWIKWSFVRSLRRKMVINSSSSGRKKLI